MPDGLRVQVKGGGLFVGGHWRLKSEDSGLRWPARGASSLEMGSDYPPVLENAGSRSGIRRGKPLRVPVRPVICLAVPGGYIGKHVDRRAF
jgi:hypothetical protein